MKRAEVCAKFGAHLSHMDAFGHPYKTAAIVLDKKHVATYAHSDHSILTCGKEVKVNF